MNPIAPKHPIDIFIGNKLQKKRQEVGLSQKALGESVELTFQQIQKYEKGTNRISASTLFGLAKQLGVSITYFFTGYTSEEYVFDEKSKVAFLADYKEDYDASIPITELDTLIKAYLSVSDKAVRDSIIKIVQSISQEHSQASTQKSASK
jgi:transcriptional regulator with XRE-family HTH domain